MDPPELAARVAPADRELPLDDAVAEPHLDPRADRVAVGPVCSGRTAIQLPIGSGSAAVPEPTLRNRLTFTRRFTCTMSSMPSRLRSTTAAPRPLTKLAMPAAWPSSTNVPSGLSDQQVARVLRREVRLRLDVALGDEQVDEPVVVDVLELGMPCRRGQGIAARVRTRRGHALVDRDVPVGRPAGRVRQRLELVVALARQVHLGQAVAGDVVAGDAHPPDHEALPPVVACVEARRLARVDAPELLLAVEVVVAVVRHPQVGVARCGPSR